MQALQNLPSSHRFHIEVLFKHFFSTIVYDFITNRLCYYGNVKDDNVSFYYSGGLKIMMEIMKNFLRVGNIVAFIISIL